MLACPTSPSWDEHTPLVSLYYAVFSLVLQNAYRTIGDSFLSLHGCVLNVTFCLVPSDNPPLSGAFLSLSLTMLPFQPWSGWWRSSWRRFSSGWSTAYRSARSPTARATGSLPSRAPRPNTFVKHLFLPLYVSGIMFT